VKRLFLLIAIVAAAFGQSTAVLSQAEIEALEAKVAANPADRPSQKLLGKNYAYYIMGVTALGKYDMVTAVDPVKAASVFATHARLALATSNNAVVVAEGGNTLWSFSFQLLSYYVQHQTPESASTVAQTRTSGAQTIDRAISLDPTEATWRSYRIPVLMQRTNLTDNLKLSVPNAYSTMRQDLTVMKGDSRDPMLASAAKLAVQAGALDDAAQYAQELLDSAASGGWNAGNAIFFGNMVLGQVALRHGDKDAAKSRLLAAGKTKGSPQLNSFGPNMTLAKELIEAGDQDTPVAFFELCRSFWKMDRGNLDRWSALATAGKVPDFGANLLY
jgi:hypothetical protein